MRNIIRAGWLALFCVLAFYSVRGARILTTHVCVAVDSFADAGKAIKQTADHLNAPTGTVAMLDKDIGATKSLIVHADLVARHEQQSMTVWDTDASALFNNLNGGVTDLRGTINAGTTAINAVPPVLAKIDTTAGHVDALISDPHIAATVAHVDAAAGNVQDMSADAKAKVHSLLHPKWWTEVINVTERVAVDVGEVVVKF